ncbi:putative ATP synthase F1, delta subunit [Clostridiales bacterium oral taxon 876 str. F0540]|nr:putative ATP synthase F1, delta subunit [Clostridiales bacterium oral taxon 876 str. F0540]
MYKFMKNFKIKTIIICLGIFSIVSVALTNFFGLSGMYRINNNMTEMYQNDLIGIARLGAARSEFLEVRLNAEKAILKYDSKYSQEISDHYKKTEDRLKEYEATTLDEFQKGRLSDVHDGIKQYISILDKIKQQSQSTNTVSEADSKELIAIGDKVESTIVELREYSEKIAAEENSTSDKVYQTSIRTVFYLAAGILAVLLFLQYLVTVVIMKSIKTVIYNLDSIASGDLTINVSSDEKNEFGIMKKALNQTIGNIKDMITSIKNQAIALENKAEDLSAISGEMSSGSQNVAATIQDVANGTSSQADEIIHTNTIINEFNKQLDEIVKSISNIASNSSSVENMAEDSSKKMNNLVNSIKNVHETFNDFSNKIGNLGMSINRINEITNLINGIADQTNLLALNASIEAARAGEAGRGFSVVAEEIRKLAEQSKIFAENINSVVNQISGETNMMVNTADEVKSEIDGQLEIIGIALTSFDNIIKAISGMTPLIIEANNSMSYIQNEKSTIVEKLESASAVSEEVAASAEEIAASAEQLEASSAEVADTSIELADMTKEIVNALDKFKL